MSLALHAALVVLLAVASAPRLALVSRRPATLDGGQVASGAIEFVAENLTDALVAPVAFFLVLGLPGAFAVFLSTLRVSAPYSDR